MASSAFVDLLGHGHGLVGIFLGEVVLLQAEVCVGQAAFDLRHQGRFRGDIERYFQSLVQSLFGLFVFLGQEMYPPQIFVVEGFFAGIIPNIIKGIFNDFFCR